MSGPRKPRARLEWASGPMRLAFAIVSLFPWGGLQRDCLRLARAANRAGHEVTILTVRTSGELPTDLDIRILPVRSFTNHGRNRRFSEALQEAVAGHFDRVIGFDKMPGLDVPIVATSVSLTRTE